MKSLSKQAYQEIKEWVHRNARPLDLALWRYHFEEGKREEVLTELAYFQNEDGGFGKKIDPDNWNPASTPYNAQIVIKFLRGIDFVDLNHPIYEGILRYLENTEHRCEYGWRFTIPSNNDHPHGIWWEFNEETNVYQSIGTTASLTGFLLRYVERNTKLYGIAVEYAHKLIRSLRSKTEFGDMGIGGYCELLEDIEAAGLMNEFDYELFREVLPVLVRQKILRETDNFMANPLEFVTEPCNRYYEANKAEVEAALDKMIDQRHELGVWDIPWEWYNGGNYPKAFAVSENWWKAIKATEKLLLLRRFGRIK
jgi:hypothetical protein